MFWRRAVWMCSRGTIVRIGSRILRLEIYVEANISMRKGIMHDRRNGALGREPFVHIIFSPPEHSVPGSVDMRIRNFYVSTEETIDAISPSASSFSVKCIFDQGCRRCRHCMASTSRS